MALPLYENGPCQQNQHEAESHYYYCMVLYQSTVLPGLGIPEVVNRLQTVAAMMAPTNFFSNFSGEVR